LTRQINYRLLWFGLLAMIASTLLGLIAIAAHGQTATAAPDKNFQTCYTTVMSVMAQSILISKLGLARKQYYSRISQLINKDVMTRNARRYFLTSFGKVVYETQVIGKAVQYSSKLNAVDSIDSAIDTLIDNSRIKEILISPQHNIMRNDSTGCDVIPTYAQQVCKFISH